MFLALLLAASAPVVGVLEFRDKVPAEQRIDAAYLSDQVRAEVKRALPESKVITRENMLVLLEASGKKLEECEGECEVDTGRRIGADLVISGELLRFGTQYKLNMKLHDTRSGELISGAVASGATADDLDKTLPGAVDKLVAPLRPEAHQDRLSDRRAAARRSVQQEEQYRLVLVSIWATLGYASESVSAPVSGSTSEGGFAFGFGGHVFLHVAGPAYLGVLADYSLFPSVGNGRADGPIAGGGILFDLGEARLSAGAGYAEISKGGGSGYGALAALDYGALRLQLAWRHGTSSVVSALNTVDQTTNVIAAQAGVSITF